MFQPGPTRGGFRGYIVPGPGARGARSQGARKSSGPCFKFFWCFFFWFSSDFGQKKGLNFSEDLFFCSSPNFGQKMGLNFSKDLFFLVIFGRDLGARHRPSYPLEKFLSEALVPTRKLDHIPGEPHGYSLRSLTPAYWPSVDFSDVAALSYTNIQRKLYFIEKQRQTGNKILSRFLPVK